MIAWLLWALVAFGQEGAATQVTASLVVQVGQPVQAADQLVDEAAKLGGWFQARTQDSVSLRVPVAQADALLAVAGGLGKVADRSSERTDLTRALDEARGRLKARQDVLARYDEVLKTADPKSIVAVEREVVRAIEQIEQLQGRIRVLEDLAAYARIEVYFRFRDRAAPRRDGSSSFPWLNTLNVVDLVGALQAGQAGWTSRGAAPATPAGFSAWRKSGRYRAISPDGVLYRVRTVKHKPKADLAFWKEAVRERMAAAGYRVVSEDDVAGGARIEVASPLGEEDWTYVIAYFVAGNRLVIAEAAGEATRFDARRQAVLDAMAHAVD